MTTAIIYASKSTEDPRGSIDRQLAACREHAQREGWDVLAEFKEEAQSGYHGNRGDQLEAACKLAEQNAPCTLLAHHSDRFARGDGSQAKHLLEYIFWARRARVKMTSVMDSQTFTEGGIGLIVGAAQGSANHDYSARLAERLRDGLADSFKQGNWHGRFPDGYKMTATRDDKGRVVEREVAKDPALAPAIERMFKLGLEQRILPAGIARDLNHAGLLKPVRPYRGKTRDPEIWRPRDVKRILRNPFYAGLMSYGGVDSRHDFPTYVTESEHRTLLQRYPMKPEPKKGEAPKVPGRRATKGFVLQRLAVCSCGANMYCKTRSRRRVDGSQKREYTCAKYGTGLCMGHIDADYVDGWVVKGLIDLISDFWTWHDEVLVGVESQRVVIRSRLEEALAEIDKLDRRQAKAQAAYESAVERDDMRGMEMASQMAERAHTARPGVLRRVENARIALAEYDDGNVTNAMLDTVTRLEGLTDAGTDAANEALRAEFERFVINVEANTIEPVAKPHEPFDLAKALQRSAEYEATKGEKAQAVVAKPDERRRAVSPQVTQPNLLAVLVRQHELGQSIRARGWVGLLAGRRSAKHRGGHYYSGPLPIHRRQPAQGPALRTRLPEAPVDTSRACNTSRLAERLVGRQGSVEPAIGPCPKEVAA